MVWSEKAEPQSEQEDSVENIPVKDCIVLDKTETVVLYSGEETNEQRYTEGQFSFKQFRFLMLAATLVVLVSVLAVMTLVFGTFVFATIFTVTAVILLIRSALRIFLVR